MDSSYRGLTRMANPDAMRLQGGIKWMGPHAQLRPVGADRMAVYLRLKNTSGSDLDTAALYAQVRTGMESAGYRVTTDVDEAQFTVTADVRFYGENSTRDLGAGMVASTVLGGVAGAVAGHAIRPTKTSTGLGAAGGALIGAGLANVMANRNKMVEIDLVVDLSVGERVSGGIETTRTSEASTRVADSDNTTVAASGASVGGSGQGGSSDTQEIVVHEDFLYHQNRLAAYAVKMALTADEALPFLSQKVAAALSGVLP